MAPSSSTSASAAPPASQQGDGNLARAWLTAEGPYRAPGNRRRLVTFTFDDGPGPKTTDAVLRVLRKYEVKGTFFLIGSYLTGNTNRAAHIREAARHIAAEGHVVGNHTLTHQRLVGLPVGQLRAEIEESRRVIALTTGVTPTFFRPPFGELDLEAGALVEASGQRLLLWSIEGSDMTEPDPEKVARELIARIDNAGGGVVLLHDVKWSSVRVLDDVLRWLRQNRYDPTRPQTEGYDVVDLPTFLGATQASPQPYADRDELIRARMGRSKTPPKTRTADTM
jgi:peptidoglycan/xylan/chitin deacetylase (PgdA/CDA1 family)